MRNITFQNIIILSQLIHFAIRDFRFFFTLFLFVFIENGFFSQTTHPDHSFFSLPLVSLDPFPHCFLQKETDLQGTTNKHYKVIYIKTRQNPHIKPGQEDTLWGKETQEQAKDSEMHTLPLLGVTQNTKLTAIAYIQSTWWRPMQVLCLSLQSLWAHMNPAYLIWWATFSWSPLPL